jgi:hypothetical protein
VRTRLALNSLRRRDSPREGEVNWAALEEAVASYRTRFLAEETILCERASLVEALDKLSQSATIRPHPPSLCHQLARFWELLSSWGGLSPLEILPVCGRHSNSSPSKTQIWRTLLRPHLLHMESCRIVFLLRCPSAKAPEGSPSPSFAIRLQQLLSAKPLQLLRACVGPPPSSTALLRPANLLQADSGDERFDEIQARFRRSGAMPFGPSGAYWVCFLLLHCSSGHAALQLATLAMARNSLSFAEYSSWPVTYIASLLESLSAAVLNSATAGEGGEAQVYSQLQAFLSQIADP